MKDSYSFDVDDAGLDKSYAAHRDAYIKIFDRLGLEYVIVSAMSGAMGGSRARSSCTRRRSARTPSSARPAGTRPTSRRSPPSSPTRSRSTGCPPAHVEDTPDTPTIETLVAVAQQLFPGRRLHRGIHAEERRRHARAPRRHEGAAGHRHPRRPGGRRQAAGGAGRARRGRALQGVRQAPGLGQGLHRPAGARRRERVEDPLPRRPRGSCRAAGGSPARTSPASTCSTWSPAATSPGTASSRPPRCSRRPRARRLGSAGAGPRRGDGPHLPARPQVRRGARPQGARRERQAGHGHHGLLRHRRLPRGRRDRRVDHDELGLSGHGDRPGRRARRRHRQGRRDLRGRAGRCPPSWSPPASPCSTTTGPRSRRA